MTDKQPLAFEQLARSKALVCEIMDSGGPNLAELYNCIGNGALDIAASLLGDDPDLLDSGVSAFLLGLEMLPRELRDHLVLSVTERLTLAENPHLLPLAQ